MEQVSINQNKMVKEKIDWHVDPNLTHSLLAEIYIRTAFVLM